MDELGLKEQKKYDTLWEEVPLYRDFCPADLLVPAFLHLFKAQIQKGESVIDFGCGTGRSAIPLLQQGLKVSLVDFCENCLDLDVFLLTVNPDSPIVFFQECLWSLSTLIQPAEWILCFDVLEHIPEEKIENVLEGISRCMVRGGLVSICLVDDTLGSLIGEKLHLTVKPANWWREKIKRYFSISHDFGDSSNTLILALSKID